MYCSCDLIIVERGMCTKYFLDCLKFTISVFWELMVLFGNVVFLGSEILTPFTSIWMFFLLKKIVC